MYVNPNHTNWDVFVPFITFEYNTSVQRSTGETPLFLTHGREARLPIEVAWGVTHDIPDATTTEDKKPLELLSRARDFVRQKMEIERQDQKDYYDKKRKLAEQFAIGDEVLVFKPSRKVGRAEKLLHRWNVPYVVV